MSDLPPEDRRRLIKSTFKEYFDECVNDPNTLDSLAKMLAEHMKNQPPPGQSNGSQPGEASQREMPARRISLFEKTILGL